ncbi:MAG: alpha/beta hydrolase [Acidimicrobiaceae bacterium]|nr:alpha/beta hydrolase [Acidimicrobiaceae bacterium]
MSTPTFLLVHGAWHGSWCWQRLGAELDERALAYDALDLPSSSGRDASADMNTDVAALRRFSQGRGPVVLVAHSYAGTVVTEAAPTIDGLIGIVYIAALVPHLGQTASDVTKEYGRRSALDATMSRDDEGFLHLEPEPAALALYGDCDEETREWAIKKVSTQTFASFRTVRTSESIAVASTYVLCSRDQAIVPEVQEQIALRCDDVVRLDSDHSPFLSHPDTLADLLESKHSRT